MLLSLLLAASPPVPGLVLTRRQAAALSLAELENLLLVDFPHEPIRSAVISSSADALSAPQPLSHVILQEVGRPAGHRFCASRRIVVVFDGLSSTDAASHPIAEDEPRRLFTVAAYPMIAVVPGGVPADCASISKFAQLPARAPDGGRRVVADVLELADRARSDQPVGVPLECTDETHIPEKPCDAVASLAGLDWASLLSVEAPSASTGPTTKLNFSGRGTWQLDVKGINRVERIGIRKMYPPPF